MAMSGYFTDGKPSPGVNTPPLLPEYDPEDALMKEPPQPTPLKNYDTMNDSSEGK